MSTLTLMQTQQWHLVSGARDPLWDMTNLDCLMEVGESYHQVACNRHGRYRWTRFREAVVDDTWPGPPNHRREFLLMEVWFQVMSWWFIYFQSLVWALTIVIQESLFIACWNSIQNGSFLWQARKERQASRRFSFCASVNSCGIHLSNFLTLLIWAK